MKRIPSVSARLGRNVALVLLISGTVFGAQTKPGNAGYLAKIGPGPLRIQAARSSAQPVVLPALPKENTDSNVNEMPANLPPTEEVKYSASSHPSPNLPANYFTPSSMWQNSYSVPNSGDASAGKPVEPLPDPVPSHPAASEMLEISPQMLVDFFRPRSQTNDTEVSVLVPVSFQPVTPAAGESKATYKTE